MFRIPEYYEMEMDFQDAWDIMKRHGRGDCLEGMKAMNRVWEEFLANERAFYRGEVDEMVFADVDDFFDHFMYEANAYNVVFEGMSELFAPKEAA